MNWFKLMNDALAYIEDHIEENIDSNEVAKIAMCSRYHFLRTFTMLSGQSLGEYIRKRRLSLAAKDLVSTNSKVIDIAIKYGYDTPEAFSKAFKRLHGVAPSSARKFKSSLKAIPPLSFQITIKGEERMDYKIVQKESFKLVGVSKRLTNDQEESKKQIPMFWQELYGNGTIEKMKKANGTVYGVGYDNDPEKEEFSYFIGIDGDHMNELDDSTVIEIPKGTWAIFDSVGPMPYSIQKVWKRVYSEWFPATKYEHAGASELEVYLPGDPTSEDYRSQIWVQIVERSI